MENAIYRLVKPGVFEREQQALQLAPGDALVRPTYMAICAADQRYWSGRRDPSALEERLPMALIHEAIGVVEHDPTESFASGEQVVMVPNVPAQNDPDTASKENYSRSSRFRSSNMDGFMADRVAIPVERLVSCEGIEPAVAVMAELVSVCCNAVDTFDQVRHVDRNGVVGIWGDGTVGYLCSLVLKERYPNIRVLLFGAHDERMERFDLVDERHNVRKDFKDGFPPVDHAFECVGGTGGCAQAIEQIIGCIRPQGVVSLMGVSELAVPINTRMVLEKGLTLQGNSRSSKQDFEQAVRLFGKPQFAQRVKGVIERQFEVQTLQDVQRAFKADESSPFKTVMRWRLGQ